MIDLLSKFTPSQIVVFVVLLCFAFKQIVDFIDWFKEKMSNRDKEMQDKQEEKEDLVERVEKLEKKYENTTEVLNNISDNVVLLIESDKDAIKSYITNQHHILCYERKCVDDYTLDCIEKRFNHYIEENGNSFIEQLMNEIRALPKTSNYINDKGE